MPGQVGGCVCVGGVCVWVGGGVCVCVCVKGWVLCVYGWGGWGVLEGWECIGRRERREITPLFHIFYIKFISS